MADLLLSVDLDPKDAIQTAKNLKKEVDKVMESKGSSSGKGPSPINTDAIDKAKAKIAELEAKMAEAAIKQEELVKQLEKMKATETPSKEYAELENQLQKVTDQMNALKESMIFNERAGGELYLNSEQFEKDAEAYEALEDQVHQLGAAMDDLEQKGKNVIDPTTTEEYQKLLAKLEAMNAKINQMNIQHEQAENKINGANEAMTNLSNETGNAQKAVQLLASAKGFGGVTKGISVALKGLKKIVLAITAITLGVRGVMGIVNKLRSAIREGFNYLMEGDKDLKKQITKLKDSIAELKANLAAAFMPIIELAIPYIQKLIDWINLLISKIAMFVAAIAGQNAYTKAIKATGDAAAGASKQLSKFDELNNITTSGGGWSTQQVPIDQSMLDLAEKFKAVMAEIKAYMTENMFEPFKEGFNSAVGDLGSKVGKIKENLVSIKDSLIEIFTDPEVQKAQQTYTQAFSRLAGEATGLLVNTGANIGQAVTGGISQYLDENKDQIKEDISDTFALATEDADKASSIVDSMSKIVDQLGESETLVDSISNILSTIEDLAVTISQIELISAGWLLDLIGPSVIENVEKLKGFLESLFETISKITSFISMVAGTVRSVLVGLFSALSPLFETIGIVIGDLVGKVVDFWTAYIAPILDTIVADVTVIWNEYIDPILQDVVSVITDLVAMISPVILALYHDVLEPLIDWLISVIGPILLPMFDMIWSAVVTGIKLVLSYLKYIFDTIKMVVHFVKSVATGDVQGAIDSIYGLLDVWFNWILDMGAILIENVARWITNVLSILGGLKTFILGFIDLFDQVAKNIGDTLEGLWEKIINTLAGIQDGLKNFWSTMLLNMVNALNKVIDKINEMLGNIFGKLGETGIGEWLSEHAKISFPGLSNAANLISNLTVPALAQGGVIPPSMGDFVARLGDNNQETEVVSPLSTMKQAFIEALQQSGGVGGNINIELTVDGNTLAQTVVRQNEIYRRQTGRSLLTT